MNVVARSGFSLNADCMKPWTPTNTSGVPPSTVGIGSTT